MISQVRSAVVPPAMIGMLGGGQLGRYALWAARQMGYRTAVVDPDPVAPAGAIADVHLVAAYDDEAAIDELAECCAVITTEFENPPATTLERLASRTCVAPSPMAVAIAQDRRAEKRFLSDCGVAVAPFAVIEAEPAVAGDSGHAEVLEAVFDGSAWTGGTPAGGKRFPAVLKTARGGYDGKGQVPVGSPDDLGAAWASLGYVACVLEQRVELAGEISVIVARSTNGRIVTYPCAENRHVDGILDVTIVPARVPQAVAADAAELATAVALALDYVGVLAVELFVTEDRLYVNEIAPRPHNSGHWSLDAAATDQFAQQIRTVAGLGPGATTMTAPGVAMANLLGDVRVGGEPDWAAALTDPDVHLHLYGKAEPRTGRKVGHLTATGPTAEDALQRVIAARSALRR